MRNQTRRISLWASTLSSIVLLGSTPGRTAATAPSTRENGVSYSLAADSAEWDANVRKRVVEAMDAAVAIYNANGDFHKAIIASYSPGTPTADGNINGSIRFGGQIGTRTALHEIAHTLGIGTHRDWQRFIVNGLWTGPHALALLHAFDGPDAVLHADRQHFWPYGLNQEREGGPENSRRHVRMVAALLADLAEGPPPTTRP